jgi:hypothetical protein
MRKLYFLLTLFLIPACGITQDLPKNDATDNQISIFTIGDILAKVSHRDIESEGECPSVSLLTKDQKKTLDSHDLCKIKIPGYREFHALKDFAFIEYSNYRLQKPSTILYDVDLAILRGSEFEVTCKVTINNQKISQGECLKIE